ncbi:glycosyltransferase family 2 protein [Hyphococcus sp.]|uniref:glycosyltransferase family 2 protein n=1 Tax=Hyphococcus sp. TaxID=2038636 RepID=UPI00208D6F38|nr:MAG: hypothetical protein DHS20C04_26560 [Marinicaulis sp.]
MKFSIIMPVLNGERFIEAALMSVLSQADQGWELIVADGGSTDDSLSIVERYAAQDSRIRFVSEPDNGMYDALFKGFLRAEGSWIGWLNADDLYAPWAIASVRRFIFTHQCDWVTGLPGSWDETGILRSVRPVGRYSRRNIAAGWHHDGLLGFLQQESMFFSRRLLEKLSQEECAKIRSMRLAGDFVMWRFFAKHTALEVIPVTLGGFRRHGGNMSVRQAADYREEILSAEPFTMPEPLSRLAALFWRMKSAWETARLTDKADRELMAEIGKDAPR